YSAFDSVLVIRWRPSTPAASPASLRTLRGGGTRVTVTQTRRVDTADAACLDAANALTLYLAMGGVLTTDGATVAHTDLTVRDRGAMHFAVGAAFGITIGHVGTVERAVVPAGQLAAITRRAAELAVVPTLEVTPIDTVITTTAAAILAARAIGTTIVTAPNRHHSQHDGSKRTCNVPCR